MTDSVEGIDRALLGVKEAVSGKMDEGAEVLGIHLEGPFIAESKAGAQPKDSIVLPDEKLFEHWMDISGGLVRLITVAPEKEGGLEFIKYAKERGVAVSLGHSNAGYAEGVAGFKAGAAHATHLFNAMHGIHHREPGIAMAALLNKTATVELIADGIHLHPAILDMVWRLKGAGGIIIVTDSMRAKYLKDGDYTLGAQDVEVRGGVPRVKGVGCLAGSVLKMSDGFKKMLESCKGISIEGVIKMVSENPAKLVGVYNRKGSIRRGKDADVVVLDENNNVRYTFCRGQLSYIAGVMKSEL